MVGVLVLVFFFPAIKWQIWGNEISNEVGNKTLKPCWSLVGARAARG
jgi:hypothetical protein